MPRYAKIELPKHNSPAVEFSCKKAAQTQKLAAQIATKLKLGSVIALTGTLGAGKTAFVQGLAIGLDIPKLEQVLSPTYTLVNEYLGGKSLLVHIDLYRLNDIDAAYNLGIEEQIHRQDSIITIEWADLFPALIPANALWVRIVCQEDGTRKISLSR